jgi:vacuolar-type H+-ATPase subunit E/Vma4
LKGVLEAIDRETAEKARKAISEAEQFAQAKKTQMKKQAERDNDELFALEEKSIVRSMRKREESIRESNLLELMKLRDRIINDIWQEASEKFLTMPSREKEYKAFLGQIFAKVKDSDSYDIFMREGDPGFRKGAKPADISGGAVFRTKDGKVEMNYSLDGIVESSEEAAKALIAEVLFG